MKIKKMFLLLMFCAFTQTGTAQPIAEKIDALVKHIPLAMENYTKAITLDSTNNHAKNDVKNQADKTRHTEGYRERA